MNKSDSIVIIPTYNEKENIEKIIRAVFSLEKCFNILVIDDGSPDGTAAIVHRLIDNEFADRLFIIERSGKLGLGTAYITGFNGHCSKDMTTYSRWTPTSVTTRTTCRAYIRLATTRATTLPLARATLAE